MSWSGPDLGLTAVKMTAYRPTIIVFHTIVAFGCPAYVIVRDGA
jgi:hypothetical protein